VRLTQIPEWVFPLGIALGFLVIIIGVIGMVGHSVDESKVVVQCDYPHFPVKCDRLHADPSMERFTNKPFARERICAIVFNQMGDSQWDWAVVSDTVIWKADTLIHPCFIEGSPYRDRDNRQWNPEYGGRCE